VWSGSWCTKRKVSFSHVSSVLELGLVIVVVVVVVVVFHVSSVSD